MHMASSIHPYIIDYVHSHVYSGHIIIKKPCSKRSNMINRDHRNDSSSSKKTHLRSARAEVTISIFIHVDQGCNIQAHNIIKLVNYLGCHLDWFITHHHYIFLYVQCSSNWFLLDIEVSYYYSITKVASIIDV